MGYILWTQINKINKGLFRHSAKCKPSCRGSHTVYSFIQITDNCDNEGRCLLMVRYRDVWKVEIIALKSANDKNNVAIHYTYGYMAWFSKDWKAKQQHYQSATF